ncbi:separase [Parastagonospora nodorum]|nr:separase [Parastagonospora nodorum]KAH5125055.1 separase [Parastagonospora nodorum]KAH5153705.1 separase [Parastagonospora nodorum]KAH5169725.1 separase [Parastagonospora nodorum]KAH5380240.1 separase [Parastagonospora nodorum]
MATKDEQTRLRIDEVKANLRSTTTCSPATVTTLQELLLKKSEEPAQKENVRAKAQTTARRRAGTATATANVEVKDSAITLSPREKYILATEVANTTLKNLADALKTPSYATAQKTSPPTKPTTSDDARKPVRSRAGHTKSASVSQRPLKERSASQISNAPQKPAIRRSSSYSSFLTTGPDTGLVSTAECARIAFSYLGTVEATKVLGKDSQELQLESGILALIGKLVALGLDGLAVKEMRHLKKRLDKYLGHDVEAQRPGSRIAEKGAQNAGSGDKESLASLLDFAEIGAESPAVPIVVNLQIYALRVIAKLSRPRIVEATWDHLKLSNPSSPANLIHHMATSPGGQVKAARQLESLAQTILSLCPHIASSHDEKPLQPSTETVLLLQQLAFKIRKTWWSLAKHQGNEEKELLEPFTKCLTAFARRSQISPNKKYRLAATLYEDLKSGQRGQEGAHASNTAVNQTLSSLAQAAGLSEEAVRWLGTAQPASSSTGSSAKQSARIVRIATVKIEGFVKDNSTPGLEDAVSNALEALGGSLSGSGADLDTLFVEVNAFRRAATRLLMAFSTKSEQVEGQDDIRQNIIHIIAASIHFSARMVGAKLADNADANAQRRHDARMMMLSKCTKSSLDSVLACCKQIIDSEKQWQELDVMLQECSHIIHRLEEECLLGTNADLLDSEMTESLLVKLSNAYWAVYLQLRKAKFTSAILITAIQRSINLVHMRSQDVRSGGHLIMKLEQLGDTLEGLDSAAKSRKAYTQCLQAHLESDASQKLADAAATKSLQEIFADQGPLGTFNRVLKSHHRSFLKSGISNAKEMAFFDHSGLQSEVRGVLLEYQLNLYLRTLSKNRHWDTNLNSSVTALVESLQDLYAAKQYPIRRLRLLASLLQLSQSHADVVSIKSLEADALQTSLIDISGSQDEGLMRFGPHLNAFCKLKILTQEPVPQAPILRECFSTWESIIATSSSWQSLADRVDDTASWLSDLKTSVEYLNVNGEEYLALPVLNLLVKAGELQKNPDPSDTVTSLCALGVQFLRLGYTGKAGLSLAKAEKLIANHKPSTEARLRWHIAFAEYLARIGNTAKGLAIMTAAHKYALADQQFMDLAKPSTTLSSRLRFNRILADATYVYSLLSTIEGSYKDAAKHARQCVALNRRIWAALESRATVKKAAPVDDSESDIDGPSKVAFDPLSSMRNEKGAPIVMSVTHDALSGPEFWSLVPALYRGLMQHSQIFAHQGLLHEAVYVAEQAEKVASASRSPTLIIDNASWRADCWAQSGRPDKAQPILDSLSVDATRKCLSIIGYQSAVARVHHWTGQYEEEVASYDTLEQLLKDLTSPIYTKTLDTISYDVDSLADQMSQMTVGTTKTQTTKAAVATTTRGRKPAVKAIKAPIRKTTAKPAPNARSKAKTAVAEKPASTSKAKDPALENTNSSEQCSVLHNFQLEITNRRVLAHLLQEDLATASALLAQMDEHQVAIARDLSHSWAAFKTMLAQSTKQIAENIAVNTLPESTIAFPAINTKERRLSEDANGKRPALASSTAAKTGRAKKPAKSDFVETLRNARDRLVQAHTACAANGPNYMFQQVSMALGTITVLLSAVSGDEMGGSIHPLYAAYMGEVPKCNALRLAQDAVEAEKDPMSRDDCLRWPNSSCTTYAPTTVSDFQREYIDIIPETWNAVSLALNDTRDELYVTRYESGLSPFLLRLPLARHASRDMDEEEFSFEDGKRDFDEIIELSDFSTRTAKDMTSREARQQWWAEREALDTRLHELLINIENIWLGGFKGVFSQHERQPSLLARFRKSLENILNQHLPSRKKKSQAKRPTLDTRVLELFIGLGDANDEELDLDEALMDLMYFVVDILHFNGERNAYDEIDFDAMVVETQEALQAYHSAAQPPQTTKHTILILDNNLHGFPWESLPCLEKLSISRLPSLAALRERLLVARPCNDHTQQPPGHYIRVGCGGTSILNPGGDLSHTSKTLQPRLDELQGPWTHIANRAPTEKEFEDSLRENELVLYFGHGSGAQFVRSKAVRRLYPGQQDDHNQKPGCATTFLFGCSSVHLTENGIYEPSGMLASYLTAGAPAVVGMLWDVTDKDCDRFAIKAGELWGLWPEPQEDAAPVVPKTPSRKAKGKGRVAQLADDLEGTRAPGSAKKGKKAKIVNDEAEPVGERRRGLGLDECVREARKSCILRYLNGAAAVVYGIPVYLE